VADNQRVSLLRERWYQVYSLPKVTKEGKGEKIWAKQGSVGYPGPAECKGGIYLRKRRRLVLDQCKLLYESGMIFIMLIDRETADMIALSPDDGQGSGKALACLQTF
jgi:hypothetical protein